MSKKTLTDKKRTDCQFQVGEMVLLKLQPYIQSSVANCPFPKLAYKYYGPYKILERVGAVAYKLDLPADAHIHPVFHVSQLKPFVGDYTSVYTDLPACTDLEAAAVLERRLVKKGNTAMPQVKVTWSGLPDSAAKWEDYYVLKQRFLDAIAWGQARSSAGGDVTAATNVDHSGKKA
ncbi:hypothetical protein U9M48_011622 [Paspalum notatum var. saurae]|uniref:Tf2-1-like SH3-like domain-containing protein n=1 Tax=Paspalum notatum var. saurae TaxID=547442 RepID=A0AAQ3SW72_PASNO